ncbi:MAG TPA: thiamine pyrophosphate-dependent enzyme, partial [Thermoplasmata archaeon]|nr:thiamine pyrophosphate-dependent enzyme [Thermoplasmata archaeon]
LFDAHRSRAPVLAIAAQIPTPEIGSGFFQETHPEQLFRECSHYCEVASHPDQIPRVAEAAIRSAISRRGVAVVVLPGNVALQKATQPASKLGALGSDSGVLPSAKQIDALAQLLSNGKRFTILAGAGCSGARESVLAIAAKLRAPIVHTIRAKEILEFDNPFDVGMTGLLGFSSGYRAMMSADVLLILGSDFPYRQFYPSDATVVQVDVRGEQIGRRTRVDLGIVGDVCSTLDALLPRISSRGDAAHLEKSVKDYAKARAGLDELASEGSPSAGVHPQYVARLVSELAADDAVFSCDVGTPTVWAARYLKLNGRRRLLGSFLHGSMANALPQAIGAQVAYPGRQVISLSGDGGLAMLLGDILTLRQHQLPVKIIVFRNDSLAFVNLEMEAAGFLDFATHLTNPDFAKLAESAGLLGLRATQASEVRPKLQQVLAHSGPALLEVQVDRQEVVLPPTLSLDEARGFGLFLLKAVLSGRGSEVIDLARTNLRR